MRAAVIPETGPPDVVETQEVPVPSVGPEEVLIEVRACAANYGDVWLRTGVAQANPPVIPGLDVAGVIRDVGLDVSSGVVTPGDRVVVYGVLGCGNCEYCTDGNPAMCVDYGAIGESRDGGQAEFVAVPAMNVIELPKGVTFRQAAALPSSFGTAHRALFVRGSLTESDDVLVLGASGGVGHAAVLLAIDVGADVYACTSSARKAEQLRDLGVTDVFGYDDSDIDEIRTATDGQGIDLAFDSVGNSSYKFGVQCLSRGGRLVTVGATAGDANAAMLRHLFWKQLSVIGSTGYAPADLERVVNMVDSGRLEPVIDSCVPLESVPDVHRRLEARDVFGKVLVVP